MAKKRATDFDVRAAMRDPGFTPRAGDAGALLDALAEAGDDARLAEQALLRLGAAAVGPASARAQAESAAHRAAALRLLGRLAAEVQNPAAPAALLAGLGDGDERVRRAAASALGRARPEGAAEALAAALGRETGASARRALVEALGKVGGEAAIAALGGEEAAGAERERGRAKLMATRSLARETPSVIVADRTPEAPIRAALRCRAGLETILLKELPAAFGGRIERDALGGLRIEGTLREAPIALFQARTFLSLGFPLEAVRAGEDPTEAVVAALTSPEARGILRRFTEGPLRFRLSFRGGGKRRAAVWRVAAEVAARAPELLNDPTESPWEAQVFEAPGLVRVELVPAIVDPRFTYRTGDVPAASHPTIAAALARAGGVRPDDVVWDPFVGSGTELCERALAGPYRRLVGSDVDPRALDVARKNLEAAGVRDAALIAGDATSLRPPGPPPTLVISNPPLGRRVHRGAGLGGLLERFVENAAGLLVKGGRLVWISPFPQRTRDAAAARGLRLAEAHEVDMGGFAAEMQVLVKR
ncbi:MAG: HEAT repeat domain-containing protein [Minicystis sp.]